MKPTSDFYTKSKGRQRQGFRKNLPSLPAGKSSKEENFI
jgi:hypothetical protein